MFNPILLSIKPKYSHEIITQNKKIEIRKKIGHAFKEGNTVYIYSSSPDKYIISFFKIKSILEFNRDTVTKDLLIDSCLSEEEMFNYIGDDIAYGIYIEKLLIIKPISLDILKLELNTFTAPQSFRYVDCKLQKIIDKHLIVTR